MRGRASRIGLTGGIGSGKSTFGALLQKRGAALVDSDQIARQVTGPGGAAIAAIVQRFGPEFVDDTGALDRGRMRELAYSAPDARTALEAIVHPLVSLHSSQQAQAAEDAGTRVIVFDVPLLVESGRWVQRLDAVIVIDCPPALQIQRVMSRSGLNRSTVEAILAAQSPRNIRRASADIVVHNGDNCTLADLHKMAEQVATRLGL
ncbi:dephospho-CoA kinase [Acidovorax temperans]|jgi:dephospho-CoA kinase|uniref:Dephospho-CoA kinase n=1 Tax=Acidovorax temperans TaxID=80878 RepID=A0A543LKW4_9BURK|nr:MULTISPECIES: dephospho-CoA kinase [Acidovorax]MBJ2164912.1 dephospho-CoA kinase [Acidovorax sp. IB03]TQN08043.1 dephospho-CoA kinase [Acidovorax temperans]